PLLAIGATVLGAAGASAQSIDLTIRNTGLSIGDSRFVRGVRINFRDDRMERVDGVNITIWTPYEPMEGTVNGFAIGLPATGARRINGIGAALFGLGTTRDFKGIGIGGIGLGGGGDVTGIMAGGG